MIAHIPYMDGTVRTVRLTRKLYEAELARFTVQGALDTTACAFCHEYRSYVCACQDCPLNPCGRILGLDAAGNASATIEYATDGFHVPGEDYATAVRTLRNFRRCIRRWCGEG